MFRHCAWKVLPSDRLCGCCTLKQFCEDRIKPGERSSEVGSRYIRVLREVSGIDALEKTRKREVVWARNMVAYQMCQDGFIQEEIARAIGRDRVTVVHCVRMMEEALKNPRQYDAEVCIWNKFKERLSLEKT